VYSFAEHFDGRFQPRPFEQVLCGVNTEEDKARYWSFPAENQSTAAAAPGAQW
jgi:hypothetical protein